MDNVNEGNGYTFDPEADGLEGRHCGPNGVSANRLTLVGAVADDYLHGRKI